MNVEFGWEGIWCVFVECVDIEREGEFWRRRMKAVHSQEKAEVGAIRQRKKKKTATKLLRDLDFLFLFFGVKKP